MFLLGLLTLGVATVPLLGGRIGRLAEIHFQRRWAGVAALVLQALVLRLLPSADTSLHALLHLVSYGLIFFFVAGNLHVPGLLVLGFGGLLNGIAIAANSGVMPADPHALATAGILGVPGEFANSAALADPKLWFLGDVFAVPKGLPLANVFSVGDMILLFGALVLLHRVCGSRLARPIQRVGDRVWRAFGRVEILRDNRPFRRLWVAQGISGIGDWVFPPAVYASLIGGNAKASDLALLLIAQVGPGMVVGAIGGPLIDRFSRKWLMVGTDLLRAVAVGSLLIGGGPPSLVHVYAVSLCLGVGGALFQPAFLAVMPNLVTKRQLAPANALVGLTQSLAVMVGFPLGAFLVDQFGVRWGFTANALTFAFSGALIARTVVPRGTVVRVTKNLVSDLAEGFRYVRSNRKVLRVILIVALIALAAGIKSPLEPLFALDSLDAGITGLGVLGAVWGGGMILGSALATWADRRLGHEAMLTVSVGSVAVAVILASFCPVIAPVVVLWLAGGVGNTMGTVAYETLLQESAADNVRGRVMAALEASLQAGLLAGVGIAALTDSLFRGSDPARAGLLLSGAAFGVAAVASWTLIQRRPARATAVAVPPVAVTFAVRGLELLRPTPGLALVRLTAWIGVDDPAPVLLVDDGRCVHRVEALPGVAQDNGTRRIGYGVPTALLAHSRSAFALDAGGAGVLDLPRPRG